MSNKIKGDNMKDMLFRTGLARENWESKYRYGNETPLETFERVAKALASVEEEQVRDYWYLKFLKTMIRFDENGNAVGLKNTFGGRITANAGTDYQAATMINCYINGPVSNAKISYKKTAANGVEIPVDIETQGAPDSLSNIMLTLLEQAETLKSEGGYGINFGFIRPRGSIIKGIGIKHPGVIHYMDIWDKVAGVIVMGDNDGYKDTLTNYLEGLSEDVTVKLKKQARKGAQMAVLPIWHPDIEEFVRAKQEPGRLTKFNISVLVDDAFMNAVDKDEFYDLHFNGTVRKRVKARELYDLIMTSTYKRAEPGILFYDNMQANNPLAYLGNVEATNPCLAKGTLVSTKNGLVPVEDISEGDEIETVLGFGAVKTVEIHENYPVYRVNFSDGSSIRATAGHIFHTKFGSESRKRWDSDTTLLDLAPGTLVRKIDYKFDVSKNPNATRDMGLLYGLYLGDGSARPDGKNFNISVNSLEDNTFIFDLFTRLGIEYRVDESEGNTEKVYASNSDRVREIFNTIGVGFSKDVDIPLIVNTNRQFAYGVIDGLLSSDGNVNLSARYVQVRFKNTNTIVHELLRHLFRLVNADYKMYESGYAGDQSTIYGRSVIRSLDIFEGIIDNDSILNMYHYLGGISHPEKNQKLKSAVVNNQLNGVRWATKIVSIEPDGFDTVYDLFEETSDTWIAGGFVHRGCGEVPGNPLTTTVCLLGSINLTQYVNEDRTFDWNQLTEDIPIFLRALDNVNDLSYHPLPQYDWATRNVRQVGMGINGLGSAFYMMGIKFNSPEGFEFLENLSYLKEDLLWKSSALLAKEKGKFPAYTDDFLRTNWFTNFNHLSYQTLDLIKEYGVRNGKVSMNAPNGNTSIICDITSNGIEPVFMYEYQRTRIVDSWPSGLTKENIRDILPETKAGDAIVWKGSYNGQVYYYEPHNRGLCVIEPVRDYGYQWVMDNYPEDIKNNYDYLVTTEGLSVYDHVDSQAIIQRKLSQSVSKTINLPAGYPFEKFKTLYKYAWNKGLIGCTTYVAGSMESVISAVDSEPEEQEQDQVLDDVIMPAEFYNGETSVVKRKGNKFYIHFSYATKNKKRPIAIWINTNTQASIKHTNQAVNVLLDLAKSKGIKQSHIDDVKDKIKDNSANNRLARAVSFCLRHRVPIVDIVIELDRLEEVYVTDLVFAIRKFLSSYVKDGTRVEGRSCNNCGSSNIEFSGGCSTCKDCGASNCA
jgi:ribonucleoside-diphosphate reductase alpha chain